MLIPLDYYRILGIPIQATEEQIAQAYHDREWQKPRREYSEMAIAARKAILSLAYKVLSFPLKRTEYDAKFLQIKADESKSDDEAQVEQINKPPISNPTIEVPSEQVVGALLLLQELGEYELVLRSGIAYLNSAEFTALKKEQDTKFQLTIKEDIILTLALAYLELGREQWQKGEYENAALSGEMGYNLLMADNLYPSVQSEIEADLDKLRPYRIIELMSQSEHKPEQKSKAFQLLRQMLARRQGIEGQGKDNSGLNFEQFLCFIQQLRKYLTATEQQELFEAEAKRPSAVATYLTVYTLLAQGFAHKKPSLIVKAQQMLQNLSKREDVSWEQAICALLLGQTQEANRVLQTTKEERIISLVQQYSQDSPDLLPGLCFYGEKWLHQEVLSQFRDLEICNLTLKEYFADRQVQNYLEQLSPSRELQKSVSNSPSEKPTPKKEEFKVRRFFGWNKKQSSSISQPKVTQPIAQYPLIKSQELVSAVASHSNGSTATLPKINSHRPSVSSSPATPRVKRHAEQINSSPRASNNYPHKPNLRPPRSKVRHKRFLSPTVRAALFFLVMVWGIGLCGFILTRMLLKPAPQTAKQINNLEIKLNEPSIDLPPKLTASDPPPKPTQMTEALAQETIEQWLASKSAALGSEHNIDALNSILGTSLLNTWRARALQYKRTQTYREYQHTVEVRSVDFDAQKPNLAIVEAQVREKAQHYQNGKLNQSKSYDDNLLVRYHLLRQNDRWSIQKSDVVKSL